MCSKYNFHIKDENKINKHTFKNLEVIGKPGQLLTVTIEKHEAVNRDKINASDVLMASRTLIG